MYRARITLFLLLSLAMLPTGCTQRARSGGDPFDGDRSTRTIRIHVTNLNFMDATLWAVTTGSRQKVGVVTGKDQAVFTIPFDLSTDLRMEIDLLAVGRCTTEPLPVDPGDDIELIIDLEFTRSPLCRGGVTASR